MNCKSFSKTFSSQILNIKSTIKEILNFFQINIPDISESDLYDLKLVFSELLINAVIHGNQSDTNKSVSFSIDISSDAIITATIIDEGLGFDYIKLIEKIALEDSLWGESGRGMCLVQSLVDHVAFNKQGNIIKFTKKVNIIGQNINC